MKILITGADGLLGNNLVRECLSRKHEVGVMLLSEKATPQGLVGLPLKRFYGNILDEKLVRSAIQGFDVVIHLAASTQVNPPKDKKITEINVLGTKHVIQACLDFQVKRLIHVGTANSFAPGSIEHPGTEENGYSGQAYGLDYFDSKYAAQKLILESVKNNSLNAIVVNPTFMIGPFDTKPSSGALLLSLHKKQIPFCTPGSKTYIAVKDACVAICNSIEMGRSGQCYILGTENYTYKDFFQLVSSTLGFSTPKLGLPSFLIKSYGNFNSFLSKTTGKIPVLSKEMARLACENHCYSGEKARKELKMPHTPLSIAIKESYRWFEENGYISKY
jgi:dihydroflavonol-4-reductase